MRGLSARGGRPADERSGPGRAKRRHRALATALALAGLLLAGCGGEDDSGSAPAEGDQMELSVLVYNVEYGGGPDTDRVIREVDADVVGVLESYERLPEMAERTGYPYYNSSLQLLSKYPILEPSGGDGLYALLEVEPGYVVPFFNEHLDYVAWGPRALRNGASVESVIETENEVRTSALERPLAAMEGLIDDGYPVFLTGDFNQPSSLDYTAETVGMHEGVDEPVPWPVSERLFELGFEDSYREDHPDPVAEPGNTHRSGERIDLVYAAGATTLDSKLVGEPGGEDVEIEAEPWTSDHFAVVSTFEVAPVAMPTLIAVDASLRTVGDEIEVTYNAPDAEAEEVAVVPEGGEPADAVETLAVSRERGGERLDTAGWDAGAYDAVLTDADGAEIARVPFYLRDPDAALELSTDRPTYAPGEPIEVSWANAPANRWDWLAVFEAAAADPDDDPYLIWAYTGGHAAGTVPPTTEGSATLGPESQGRPWPLPDGDYVVQYLLADQYESAASTPFRVRGGG